LTKLSIADASAVVAPKGQKLTMTVDGIAKPIKPGTYTGAIVLTARKHLTVPMKNRPCMTASSTE
jgi:hypothetical protein